jgi:hypothetical protein
MAAIIYRANPIATVVTTVKNSALLNEEIDGNFKSINDDIQNRTTNAELNSKADELATLSLMYSIALG